MRRGQRTSWSVYGRWDVTEWSECSTSCDRGQQSRKIDCKQRISAVLSVPVKADRCVDQTRPPTVRTCNVDRPCVRWTIGNWSQVRPSTVCPQLHALRFTGKMAVKTSCEVELLKTSQMNDFQNSFITRLGSKFLASVQSSLASRLVTHCGGECIVQCVRWAGTFPHCWRNALMRQHMPPPPQVPLPAGGSGPSSNTWFLGST